MFAPRSVLFAWLLSLLLADIGDAQWVQTGLSGSSVNCFAASGAKLFAGTDSSVFLSTNNGASWTSVRPGLGNIWVSALAVSGTNLFAGTVYGGVYLSTNSGTSWIPVNIVMTNGPVRAFAVSGTNLFAGTDYDGVYLSTNSGTSWTQVDSGLTALYVDALAVSGTNLFAGTYDSGVFRSTNSGAIWTQVNTGLTHTGVLALAFSGTNLFAGGDGVYLSTNSGNSWTPVDSGLTALYVGALAVSGTNLFAGTYGSGVFRSTNSGASWTQVDSGLTALHVGALAVSGTDLFVGTDSDVWRRPLSEMIFTIGTLAVTVQDAEDWGQAGPNANVRLYSSSGQLLGTQRTNASSVATFTNLPSGSGYYYTVEYMPTDSTVLLGTLYWGRKNGITIASGQTTLDTFVRNAPYAPAISVFNSLTNANVTSQVVLVGTPLRIDLTVKNPSYVGADSQSVRGRVVLDTNKTLPFVVDMSSTLLAMPVGSTSTISFGFTPHAPGSYYRAGVLIARINGNDTYTERFTSYDQPFFTVAGRNLSIQERDMPKDFALWQNYPNPFNPSTVIRWELPRESYVRLRVYNPLGQEIRTLIDATMSAGVYEVRFDAGGLPSGMYIYRMKAGEFVTSRRLLLVR